MDIIPIGLFSKINRITTKTLRHYDAIGLLKPAFIDASSGYRYYSNDQLPLLGRIMALKQIGMSLQEIQEILQDANSEDAYLAKKELELEETVMNSQKQLAQLRAFRKCRSEENAPYTAMLKALPGGIVACMRFLAPNYDAFFTMIPPMGDEMRRQGAECAQPAYCFNVYHDGEYKEKDIDVECCEMVIAKCEDSELVQYKTLAPVSQAVCVYHKGPYRTLPFAYTFALQWMQQNGYHMQGPPRESYIDGIWNKEREEDWLTEVQIPVEA